MQGWPILWQLACWVMSPSNRCVAPAILCVSLELLGVAGGCAGPYLLKQLVDGASHSREESVLVVFLVLGFVASWTAPTALTSIRGVYSARINSRISMMLTSAAVGGFLSGGAWRASSSGGVHAQIERVPYSLAVVVDGLIWRTAPLLFQIVAGLAVILNLMSWKYVVVLAGFAAGFTAVSAVGLRYQADAAKAFNQAAGLCGALVGDILRNPRRIVSNGATGQDVGNVVKAYGTREAEEEGMYWSLARLSGSQWVLMLFALTVMLSLALGDVGAKRITAGDFVLLQAYVFRLVLPLAGVGFILSQSAAAFANLEEVFALKRRLPRNVANPPAVPPCGAARVDVRNLSFRYPGRDAGIENVTVSFPPSSFSVIVGKNGAGKSTLAQLLAGLLPAQHGMVYYDGRPISELDEAHRYKQVLYVPQRVSLLNRSLIANLLYPPSRLSEADAFDYLVRWGFYADGAALNLNASVGEGGDSLSGGQVQKLELARLLGVQVPCLILDESTSALDPAGEALVLTDFIRTMSADTTIIMVAHRVAIAAHADQVIWMRDGQLQTVGRHEELIRLYPDYKALWG